MILYINDTTFKIAIKTKSSSISIFLYIKKNRVFIDFLFKKKEVVQHRFAEIYLDILIEKVLRDKLIELLWIWKVAVTESDILCTLNWN